MIGEANMGQKIENEFGKPDVQLRQTGPKTHLGKAVKTERSEDRNFREGRAGG